MAEAVNTGDDGGSVPPDGTDTFPSEEYECKICYSCFDLDLHTPKRLNCSHTFCQECLDALHCREGRGWRICCPVCRHPTLVPEYRIHNLPDNTAVAEALPPKTHEPADSLTHEPADSSNSDVQPREAVSSVPSPESNDSCHTCKRVMCVTGCVCAILVFLSIGVGLIVAVIIAHTFDFRSPWVF